MSMYIIQQTVILVALYFFIFFIVGTIIKNNSIVDIGWGLGFVIIAWFTLFLSNSFFLPNIIITIAVTIWGLRLFTHILKRNRGKGEDFRYAAWRKQWGRWVIPRAFFQVYMLQGIFMLTVASPFIILNSMQWSEFTWITAAGALLWIIGFFFESVGDYQLEQFKKNPKNKGTILRTGLWKYTRHPNYFGESAMWWGIGLAAFGSGAGIISFISPFVITFLLLFVSGVPMLEKSFEKRPGYKSYKEVTSVFIPLPPKKRKYDI
ncbi:DUF1295 domain-containing protein [Proteocatella sphenisci]|uniref:DUF1295 domain-containing protein n=1 Tax=Proteocatella sphenisci TaxID=181070 RepID=UPI0004AEA3B3|nr:DUF1295 domain-containing protein [Proteocatella sphenisci]